MLPETLPASLVGQLGTAEFTTVSLLGITENGYSHVEYRPTVLPSPTLSSNWKRLQVAGS